MTYFFLSSGWWRSLKIFLLLYILVALRILRCIGIPWVDFIFQQIFMWSSTRGISQFWFLNPPKFEWASQLVRKVFTSSRCYPHGYLLNAESTLMAWFWRVFILPLAQWRSKTWVFGLQVTTMGWSSKVRLSFDTSMLNVSWLVRRLASVGVLGEYYQC
jgi:hypothetical protein